MATDIQSSFIPKQVLTREVSPRRESLGLFFLLSVVVLIVALLFFGGTYIYKTILVGEIERPCPSAVPDSLAGCGLLASLEVRRQSIEQERILEIERLDKQLKLLLSILNNHQTFLPAFQFLEDETLQSIRYGNLSQAGPSLSLRGSAKNYEGIALQSIIFADHRLVKDFVFSDLNADAADRISFNLKLDLDPALLSYLGFITSSLP